MTTRTTFALTAGLLLALAAPAAAGAATLTVEKPCYPIGADVKVGFAFGGFDPGSFVSLSQNGSLIDAVQADAAGAFVGEFGAPGLGDQFRETVHLTATGDGGLAAAADYAVSDKRVTMSPAKARPSTRVRFTGQGFVGGGTLYAHYIYAGNQAHHRFLKTVKAGALSGPCGDVVGKKLPQLPIKHPKSGPYVIQFDTSQAFREQQGVYVERDVFVAPRH